MPPESGHDVNVDLLVLGGGPAGLAAGLYAARGGLRTLLVDRMPPGGQLHNTARVENYPGFPGGVDGPDLASRFLEQATAFGLECRVGTVGRLTLSDQAKELELDGQVLRAPALVLTTGTSPRRLAVPGEEELAGRGVTYCATCDGPLFKGADVAVVGGGDAAVQEAIFLSRLVRRVNLIHRRSALRAAHVLQERLRATENISVLWDSVAVAIEGEDRVTAVRIRHAKTGLESRVPVAAVFVYVGLVPNTDLVRGQLELDAEGYVAAGEETGTSVPGVFAAGDVRHKSLRQVVTAVADGAVAAMAAIRFLEMMGR